MARRFDPQYVSSTDRCFAPLDPFVAQRFLGLGHGLLAVKRPVTSPKYAGAGN
jgi:hypothetical protein